MRSLLFNHLEWRDTLFIKDRKDQSRHEEDLPKSTLSLLPILVAYVNDQRYPASRERWLDILSGTLEHRPELLPEDAMHPFPGRHQKA